MTSEKLKNHPQAVYTVVIIAVAAKLAISWSILIEVYGTVSQSVIVIASLLDIAFMIIIYMSIRNYLPEDIHHYALSYLIFESLYHIWWTISTISEENFLYWDMGWFLFQALPFLFFALMLKEFNKLDTVSEFSNNPIVQSGSISALSDFGYIFFLFSGFACLFVPVVPSLGFIAYLFAMFLYPLIYGALLHTAMSTTILIDESPPKEQWVTPTS